MLFKSKFLGINNVLVKIDKAPPALFAAIGGVFTLVLLKLAVPLNENLLESFVEPPSPML